MKNWLALIVGGMWMMGSLWADVQEGWVGECLCELEWEHMIYVGGEGALEVEEGVFVMGEGAEVTEFLKERRVDGAMISVVEEEEAFDFYRRFCKEYAHFFYFPKDKVLAFTKCAIIEPIEYALQDSAVAFLFSVIQRSEPYILFAKSGGCETRGEVGATMSWGGNNGVELEGYVKGSVNDSNGNYVEAKVTQRNDGSGEATVRGVHEDKKKK